LRGITKLHFNRSYKVRIGLEGRIVRPPAACGRAPMIGRKGYGQKKEAAWRPLFVACSLSSVERIGHVWDGRIPTCATWPTGVATFARSAILANVWLVLMDG